MKLLQQPTVSHVWQWWGVGCWQAGRQLVHAQGTGCSRQHHQQKEYSRPRPRTHYPQKPAQMEPRCCIGLVPGGPGVQPASGEDAEPVQPGSDRGKPERHEEHQPSCRQPDKRKLPPSGCCPNRIPKKSEIFKSSFRNCPGC